MCYGLTLPLTEHDTVRDCVNVYCEWLSALHPVPKISVPIPVCNDANFYARKIIAHFLNLFMPRSGEGKNTISMFTLSHSYVYQFVNLTERIFFCFSLKSGPLFIWISVRIYHTGSL